MNDQRRPVLPASNLLISAHPLTVLPLLAKAIGLNQAIALQQVRYWLERSQNERDGRWWVYNSIKEWTERNFPFWSEATVKRVFAELEQSGVLLAASHYNKSPMDRTKWYTIDFAKLAAIEAEIVASAQQTDSSNALDQVDQMDRVSVIRPVAQSDQMDRVNLTQSNQRLPETTSETTQKDISSVCASAGEDASANDPATCLNAHERRRYCARLGLTFERLDREIARVAALPRQGRTLRHLVIGHFEAQLNAASGGGNRRRA